MQKIKDVSKILLQRGIEVTYETIRQWSKTFAHQYAKRLKKRLPRPGDKWHVDEVKVVINGEIYWLWRAIDSEGDEIDVLLHKRRSAKAAKRFFQKILKRLSPPPVLTTDKLGSY